LYPEFFVSEAAKGKGFRVLLHFVFFVGGFELSGMLSSGEIVAA